MATYNLGKVCLTPRGEYSPSTTYEALDVVSYSGGSYLVLKEVTGTTPVVGEFYMLLASKGNTGETGQAATISVGIVTTSTDSEPHVINSGTANDAVFDFQLLQGPSGNVGSVDSVAGVDGNVPLNAVRYTSQTLSTVQKAQARTNIDATLAGIGAASAPSISSSLPLNITDWGGSTSCTKTITGKGILSTSVIIIGPSNESYSVWTDSGVRCTGSGTNELSFACESVPTADLTYSLVVWNG